MLPNEDMARILAGRRRTETERVARDRGFLHDTRPTPASPRPTTPTRPTGDRRPCPTRPEPVRPR